MTASKIVLGGLAVAAAGIGFWALKSISPTPDPARAIGKPAISRLVRLSASQYAQTIVDVFGPTIEQGTNPNQGEARVSGLLAVGAARVSYSPAAFSSAHDLAESIAAQVTNPTHRYSLIPCRPANPKQADDACAQQFFSGTGRLLWRRALSQDELNTQVQWAHEASERLHDFYAGIQESLTTMLTSPNFLFRVEQAEAIPGHPGVYQLTAYSKAARLAALLWNSNPDGALLTAAETGRLDTPQDLSAQVDRMLASRRAENGVRAFFTDLLEFDKFSAVDKDPTIYPRYTNTVGKDMQESLLRVLVDELLVNRVPYPQLFRTHETYLTPALAALIDVQIPLPQGASNGAPGQDWTKYEFAANDPRAGFLTMPAFTAMNSHPGKSSPTLRGKAIREDLLCQKVPDPPANVNFAAFNDPKSGPTARDRLQVHRINPICAGCHRIMDPLGLSLENFDGSGGWRTTENNVTIDASGSFNNVSYKDAAGLDRAVGNSAAAESCLVSRMYAYATAQATTASDKARMHQLEQQFDQHGRQYPELLKLIATSPEFSQLTEGKLPAPPASQAARIQASAKSPGSAIP